MYMKELPAMNYAANTGKQSMFLERCVTNGYKNVPHCKPIMVLKVSPLIKSYV